jgi:hypothetical protein
MSDCEETCKPTRLSSPPFGWFIVKRTSDWGGSNKPCEGAIRAEVKITDARRYKYPSEFPGGEEQWFGRGENHRIENGGICRDIGWGEEWVIQVGNVLEFVDKHGECVVSRDRNGWPTIEIYDGYRE